MKTARVICGLLIAAGVATGRDYIREDFSTPGLPAGWGFEKSSQGNNYYADAQGPFGPCKLLYSSCWYPYTGSYGVIYTYWVDLATGTYYYSFYAVTSDLSYYYYLCQARFRVAKEGSSTYLVQRDLLDGPLGAWRLFTGSFAVTGPSRVRLEWYTATTAAYNKSGHVEIRFDEAYLTDDPHFAVEPASLGLVKALYY